MHTKRWDVGVLAAAGLGLWAIAAFFLWRDLEVPLEAFLCVVAVPAAVLSMVRLPERWRWVGPGALLGCALGGSVWFGATTSPVLLAPLAVTLAASVAGLSRSTATDGRQRLLLWYALAVSALATSGAVYFHVFTLGFMADQVGRRIILSAVWLVFGLVLVVLSIRAGERSGRDAGFAALAVAVGKVIFWDTAHLGGMVRAGLLLSAGALLLLGAWAAFRVSPARGAAQV